MTKFARVWVTRSSIGVVLWCYAAVALFAQSGGGNNPLRGNQPLSENQPAQNNQPRVATQQNRPSQPNTNPNQTNTGILPNGQTPQPQQLAIQPPFNLTPQEQADLDKLLAEWEAQSNKITSFKCTFRRWEYNPAFANGDPNQATTESEGEIKYYSPDKGLFRVTKSWDNVIDPTTGKFQPTADKPGEYWTCTGESIFQVNHLNKTVEEHPLPPHLKGKAITDGPLPFVFGAKAVALKHRYFMRIVTPQTVANKEIWLEAIPKTRQDAANFSRIELILEKQKLLPLGMQIHDPGANANNQSRTVIMLAGHSVNDAWLPIQQIFNDFAKPNYLTYKHVVVQPQAPAPVQGQPPAQVQNSGTNQPPSRQATVPQARPQE